MFISLAKKPELIANKNVMSRMLEKDFTLKISSAGKEMFNNPSLTYVLKRTIFDVDLRSTNWAACCSALQKYMNLTISVFLLYLPTCTHQ